MRPRQPYVMRLARDRIPFSCNISVFTRESVLDRDFVTCALGGVKTALIVDLSRGHMSMPQQFLHLLNVDLRTEQQGRRRRSQGMRRVDGVCSGYVRQPVIATIVQESKPSRSACWQGVKLVKSKACTHGFAGPFSDTQSAHYRF